MFLCLHFPHLPLEVFSRAQALDTPWVVAEGQGKHQRVLLCNAPASAAGRRCTTRPSMGARTSIPEAHEGGSSTPSVPKISETCDA